MVWVSDVFLFSAENFIMQQYLWNIAAFHFNKMVAPGKKLYFLQNDTHTSHNVCVLCDTNKLNLYISHYVYIILKNFKCGIFDFYIYILNFIFIHFEHTMQWRARLYSICVTTLCILLKIIFVNVSNTTIKIINATPHICVMITNITQ